MKRQIVLRWMIVVVALMVFGCDETTAIGRGSDQVIGGGFNRLPILTETAAKPVEADWLIEPVARRAGVFSKEDRREIVMTNGLISRTFRVMPNAATIAVDNLMTGESMLRGVKPEAMIEIDGMKFAVGGLLGQPDYAYLLPEWVEQLGADPKAFQFTGFEVGKIEKRFEWKRKRYSADLPWPASGVMLTMNYRLTDEAVYDMDAKLLTSDMGRRLLIGDDFAELSAKWTVHQAKHERSSFVNEGKVGEIYTPANTCVYAERKLPAGVRLVQCYVHPGTDRSASWGPGIAVVFADRVIKFGLRPGKEQFGIFNAGYQREVGKIDPGKGYYLRLRIAAGAVHCE
ncbi:MAG: hypothetical protein J7M40_10180, partial [Planctomycetes bacterium]|nr:hypothetical protein [Planctomycetota bacterium]